MKNPMTLSLRVSISAACAASLFSCGLFAQGGGGGTTPPQPQPPGYHVPGPGATIKEQVVSDKDREFLEKAAKSGIKEVAVSQAMLARASSPEVRAFAQMMVTDHTAANQELKTLAASKFVPLPAETDADKYLEEWKKKSGDVDKEYLKEMVADHKKAVELFEKGTKANDPEIAAFARKTLPKLKHHLEQVQGHEHSK
jgi:putative membrane protein